MADDSSAKCLPFAALYVAFQLIRGRRLGDTWARTRVIWMRYAQHPLFLGTLACERCQSDLTGNTSGICPECGAPLSQANRLRLVAAAPPTPVGS